MTHDPAQDPIPDTVVIPDDWRNLDWPLLRSLGASLSPTPVNTSEEAVSAIEAELARRAELGAEDAATAQPDAATAQADAATAQPDAATAQADAATAQTDVATAQTDAATAQTDAATAQTDVATAQTDAATAQTDAATAQTGGNRGLHIGANGPDNPQPGDRWKDTHTGRIYQWSLFGDDIWGWNPIS